MPVSVSFTKYSKREATNAKTFFGRVGKGVKEHLRKRATKNDLVNKWLPSFYSEFTIEINRYLDNYSKLSLKSVERSGEEPLVSINEKSVNLGIKYSTNSVISYVRFPHQKIYRDPSRNFGIHKGASKRFRRYAVTNVTVMGKSVRAGKRGSELQGLGWEPMGLPPWPSDAKPKADPNNRKQYRLFIRILYPNRKRPETWPSRPNKDITILGTNKTGAAEYDQRLVYPIYTKILKTPDLNKDMFRRIKERAISQKGGFFDRLRKDTGGIVSRSGGKIRNLGR